MAFQPSAEELQQRLDARLDNHLCVVKFRDDEVVLSLRDLRTGRLTIVSGLFPATGPATNSSRPSMAS